MKVMQLSDLHLGLKRNGMNREAEEDRILQYIIDTAKEKVVDTIIINGDVTEYPTSPSERINKVLMKFYRELGSIAKMVIINHGNHDWNGFSGLQEFTSLTNIHYIDKPRIVSLEEAEILVIPYFDVRKSYKDFNKNILVQAKAEFLDILDKGFNSMNSSKKRICCYHGTIEGVISNLDDNFDRELILHPDEFKRFDLVMLGHIHNQQVIGDKIFYSGSTMKCNFGEENAKYGFLIHNIQQDGIITTAHSTPIKNFRTMYFDIKDFSSFETMKQHIKEYLPEEDEYIRLRIIGDTPPYAKIELSNLSENIVKVEFENVKIIEEIQLERAEPIGNISMKALFEKFLKTQKGDNSDMLLEFERRLSLKTI